MFESDEAAKSRLQFISQLAGSTAGLSMLAACGRSGLLDSRGNPISPAPGFAPGPPLLETEPRNVITAPPLTDTPEFQEMMFKTNLRAVTHNGLAVIRDDLKRSSEFVDFINARLTLESISHRKHGKLSPLNDGDDDDGGDGWGDWGDGVYYPLPGPHNAPLWFNGLPRKLPFGFWNVGQDRVYLDVYQGTIGAQNAIVSVLYPWFAGPTYYTGHPAPDPCADLRNKLTTLANKVKSECLAHEIWCSALLGELIALGVQGIALAFTALAALSAYTLGVILLALSLTVEAFIEWTQLYCGEN